MQHQTITPHTAVEVPAIERLAAEYRGEIARHTDILRVYRLPAMRNYHRQMRVQQYLRLRGLRKWSE